MFALTHTKKKRKREKRDTKGKREVIQNNNVFLIIKGEKLKE
jgi:hypothetical protein